MTRAGPFYDFPSEPINSVTSLTNKLDDTLYSFTVPTATKSETGKIYYNWGCNSYRLAFGYMAV